MDYVSISGVVSCLSCPVRYYLEKNSEDRTESPGYTIAKQISYHLGRELCEDEIWDEIMLVNPEINEEEYYPVFLEWLGNCRKNSWPLPRETDVEVRSEKLGVKGRIDLVYSSDPKVGIVRTGNAPENGIYKSDRVRAALLAICASGLPGIDADEVMLHYIPEGITRICRPVPADRRNAIRALATAKKIEIGYIPEKPKHSPCENCYMKDSCESEPVKVSDLF